MSPFIIIVAIVLIIALAVNYLTKEKDPSHTGPIFIEPLLKDFKPVYSDMEMRDTDENTDEAIASTPPMPINQHFPPNPSEEYIESYYQSMSEIEQPESEEVNRQIHTVNMFVESHHQLNLSMLGRGLTVEMIYDAYEKLLNEHVNSIAMGKTPTFNIGDKQKAKVFLIEHLKKIK